MSPRQTSVKRERTSRNGTVPWRAADRAQWERQLLARLQSAAGHLTFAQIGEVTGVHPETVRRYMTRGRPTAFFVGAICRALSIPLEWLITGVAKDAAVPEPKPSNRNGAPEPAAEVVNVIAPAGLRSATSGGSRRVSGSR